MRRADTRRVLFVDARLVTEEKRTHNSSNKHGRTNSTVNTKRKFWMQKQNVELSVLYYNNLRIPVSLIATTKASA